MPVEEQVVAVFAGTSGALDDLPVEEIKRFEGELLEWFRSRHAGLLSGSATGAHCPRATRCRGAVNDFKTSFLADGAQRPRRITATADVGDTDAETEKRPSDPTGPEGLRE